MRQQKNDRTIFVTPLTENETCNLLKTTKEPFCARTRRTESRNIKTNATIYKKPLTYIINLCFTIGQFPDTLKQAVVIPLYKDGDKQQKQNYRHISLTLYLEQNIKKAIKNRLTKFLTDTFYVKLSVRLPEAKKYAGCHIFLTDNE